jgi:hypothetical protein
MSVEIARIAISSFRRTSVWPIAPSEQRRSWRGRSEDALYFDARHWTADDETHAKELQQKHRILTNAQWGRTSEKEYPD